MQDLYHQPYGSLSDTVAKQADQNNSEPNRNPGPQTLNMRNPKPENVRRLCNQVPLLCSLYKAPENFNY